jgi:hypothetical protein
MSLENWRLEEGEGGRGKLVRVSGKSTTTKHFASVEEAREKLHEWRVNGTSVECGDCLNNGYVEPYKSRIIDEQHCFTCLFWADYVRSVDDPSHVRVNGRHYVILPDRPKFGGFVGFDGQEFRFRFHDGRTVVSHNVWTQGMIPEHFRERLPDNAILLTE